MSNSHPPTELESRLDRLGRDLAERPSSADSIMNQIARLESHEVTVSEQPRSSGWILSRTRIVTSVALAACALVAATVVLSQPATLYARTLDALSRVGTIHVTGTSAHVPRDWPLEHPLDSDKETSEVEMWYWRGLDGTSLGYERIGPVTKSQVGGSLKEYQKDVDLLYVAEGARDDQGMRFATIEKWLQQLNDVEQEDLGTREEDGQLIRGLRMRRHGRLSEFWFDEATDLPVRMARMSGADDGVPEFELRFSYNEAVPEEVASYKPPAAKITRYGGSHDNVNLEWKLHVQSLLEDETPLDDDADIGLVTRDGERSFANQWRMQTSDGQYWVMPVDCGRYLKMNIDHLIRLQIAHVGGEHPVASWRVDDESLLEIDFPRSDLIFKDGTPWKEWVSFLLSEHGLEYIDVEEERTFWVAQHDGRELKDYNDVLPPVPYVMQDGKPHYGISGEGGGFLGNPVTLERLFRFFNRQQNHKYAATHPIIVDETGLPKAPEWDEELYPSYRDYSDQVLSKYYVAADAPRFAEVESRQMARDWYAKEFGITFKEEKRPMTIHVIRRKSSKVD